MLFQAELTFLCCYGNDVIQHSQVEAYLLSDQTLMMLPAAAYSLVPVSFTAMSLIWVSPAGMATVRDELLAALPSST